MPLIGRKVEMKLNWTSHCFLSALGSDNSDNADANSNNIIFTIKETKLYLFSPFISKKQPKPKYKRLIV